MEFKDRLRMLCHRHNLTQKELAAKIFVSRSTIAKWMSGRGFPCKANIEQLCNFFGVEEAWLFGIEDVRKTVESCTNAVHRAQKSLDAGLAVFNTILLYLHIVGSLALLFSDGLTSLPWLSMIVAVLPAWNVEEAVRLLYAAWASCWQVFVIWKTKNVSGKVARFLAAAATVAFGTLCSMMLYAIAFFLVYPSLEGRSGYERISKALYRFGASIGFAEKDAS